MTTTDPILAETTRRLVEGFDPQRIILFGSRARGTAGVESDVDLIVICEIVTDRNGLEARMIGAMRGINAPVDILVFTPEEFASESEALGSVVYPAAREGKVLYERAA